ncbi:RimJ/RimL family protein N-acetyltransferase [Streptosporangium becharense]|uniref:RimJ/RimL family protein N-acetyltransferase n=1 Tax=Streptosporangium becharense TaxID=1816182 RepID=A0A7W9ICQ2_9ACTN|nr:GNAT family N-acetyltransferase [Streptosporangium becharense]MBB2913755.1 RimJ/RimL family protein N-acetyltransferase [Streptosporangium becharense]MBB5817836.1 RimJ/RimL family protein N-acetyltransferase [Streptosporangium becharense]
MVLRALAPSDAEAIARACSDPEIIRFIPPVPVPYTHDDALRYLEQTEQEWKEGGAAFAIADAQSGEWLGNIGLRAARLPGNAEIGYLVAPWARGRGVATAATRALAAWALERGTERIELLTDPENLASQRVALAAGFRREGVRRAAEPRRDGTRGDLVAFARLRGDSGEPVRPFLPPFPGGSLTDGVVRLRPITAADTADYLALRNVPDAIKYSVPPEAPDPAEVEETCRMAGTRWLAGERAEVAILDAATGAFAGDIQLTGVIPPLGEAMTGYSVLPAFRGRRFAARAVNLLVAWAFEHTPLVRIIAGTAPENTASHRVLERAGFSQEALLRGLLPGPDGTRLDDLRWYRLREGLRFGGHGEGAERP